MAKKKIGSGSKKEISKTAADAAAARAGPGGWNSTTAGRRQQVAREKARKQKKNIRAAGSKAWHGDQGRPKTKTKKTKKK